MLLDMFIEFLQNNNIATDKLDITNFNSENPRDYIKFCCESLDKNLYIDAYFCLFIIFRHYDFFNEKVIIKIYNNYIKMKYENSKFYKDNIDIYESIRNLFNVIPDLKNVAQYVAMKNIKELVEQTFANC